MSIKHRIISDIKSTDVYGSLNTKEILAIINRHLPDVPREEMIEKVAIAIAKADNIKDGDWVLSYWEPLAKAAWQAFMGDEK